MTSDEIRQKASGGAAQRRMMRLPKNSQHPNYVGIHPEDDWCAKAGCTPVCGAGAAPPAASAGRHSVIVTKNAEELLRAASGSGTQQFNYLAVVAGGRGPNVWDKEIQIVAVSVREAAAKIESQFDHDAEILSIERLDELPEPHDDHLMGKAMARANETMHMLQAVDSIRPEGTGTPATPSTQCEREKAIIALQEDRERALITTVIARAVEREREECAKLCDEEASLYSSSSAECDAAGNIAGGSNDAASALTLKRIAKAIRSRASQPVNTESPICNKPTEFHLIAGASWYACVLPQGHNGKCKPGGTCVAHGPYVCDGYPVQCPRWPECVKELSR